MQKAIFLVSCWMGAALPLAAQASLSAQGFGFPPGQMSIRAMSAGGALGETDAESALNPASLGAWGGAALVFSYAPEFRKVFAGGAQDRTTTTRFPLFAGAVPLGEHGAIGLTTSTLLDRSWRTRSQTSQVLGGTTVTSTETFASLGAINDIRLAGAWAIREGLTLGLGAHALTGENRISIFREFSDDTAATFGQASTVSYGGMAVSGGFVWEPSKVLAIAASARLGGTMRARSGADSVLSSARVPNRFGGEVKYDGVPGTSLAVRVGWDGWSSLGSLGTSSVTAFDAWDASAGADVAGPRMGSGAMRLRAGTRFRTLPFGVAGAEVRERSLAFGIGLPIARERALFDLGLQRANRSGGGGRESAWTFGLGVTIRP